MVFTLIGLENLDDLLTPFSFKLSFVIEQKFEDVELLIAELSAYFIICKRCYLLYLLLSCVCAFCSHGMRFASIMDVTVTFGKKLFFCHSMQVRFVVGKILDYLTMVLLHESHTLM